MVFSTNVAKSFVNGAMSATAIALAPPKAISRFVLWLFLMGISILRRTFISILCRTVISILCWMVIRLLCEIVDRT